MEHPPPQALCFQFSCDCERSSFDSDRRPSRQCLIADEKPSRYSSSEPCRVSVASRPTSKRGDVMGVRFIPSPNETTKPAAGTCPFWLSFRRPSSLALYRNFLQHKVRRVFRSLAIGYAKSELMQVQTVQQWLALTEENRRQREMHGVDQPL